MPMIKVKEKLNKVHVDIWKPHYALLLSRKIYIIILLDAKTWKSWIMYLQSKDEFINIFQIWLSIVEN